MKKVVRNIRTLNAMERMGLIKTHSDTLKFKYVNDGKNWFRYKGKEYSTEYVDGCFYPFVFELITIKETNIKQNWFTIKPILGNANF